MAVDKQLVAEWIQYLKSTQVAFADKNNPGKLKYKKPVTAQVLQHFLTTSSNFTPKQIDAAIQQALAGKANNPANPKNGPAGIPHDPNSVDDANYRDVPPPKPGATAVANPNPAPMPPRPQPALRGSRYNNRDAEDADYKEVPRTPKAIGQNQPAEKPAKPHYKMTRDANGKPVYTRLREDFEDDAGAELDEKDVERVFEILSSQQTPEVPDQEQQQEQPAKQSPEQKQKDMNSLKRIIRDNMDAGQRKAFYRLLTDDNSTSLSEEQISNSDAKALFKTAADTRAKGGIPGFRKDKISIGDLQKAWSDAGYPDDTRDISAILKKQFGFSDREIKKVFAKVFGGEGSEDDAPAASPALQKIADYAKEHGLVNDAVAFMQQEYGEELGITKKPGFFSRQFGKKAVAEEVRQIFTDILEEQREDRFTLIRQQEHTQLGRSKK